MARRSCRCFREPRRGTSASGTPHRVRPREAAGTLAAQAIVACQHADPHPGESSGGAPGPTCAHPCPGRRGFPRGSAGPRAARLQAIAHRDEPRGVRIITGRKVVGRSGQRTRGDPGGDRQVRRPLASARTNGIWVIAAAVAGQSHGSAKPLAVGTEASAGFTANHCLPSGQDARGLPYGPTIPTEIRRPASS